MCLVSSVACTVYSNNWTPAPPLPPAESRPEKVRPGVGRARVNVSLRDFESSTYAKGIKRGHYDSESLYLYLRRIKSLPWAPESVWDSERVSKRQPVVTSVLNLHSPGRHEGTSEDATQGAGLLCVRCGWGQSGTRL